MPQHGDTNSAKAGQRVALTIAGIGVFWVLVTLLGNEYGWSIRVRAFFDLAVLAAFGFSLWQVFRLWRMRQNEKGDD